jgi:Tol biopolymer transport system component
VYRAHDTKLGRDVAIKILPAAFTSDPDRRARFDREARLLAALNHPHIATVHGVEETGGVQAIVLELVEGPTLADRVTRGPLPVKEALSIAGQIADALDAAHEKGIVHRDLKPANIKLTPDGQVKVLDFGLAMAVQGASGDRSLLPTQLVSESGTVMGTAAYMSPEQARGQVVDKRTDIWAFGCVLYELLTGRRAFDGATSSEMIAKVLEREPDWNALPATTPPAVKRLVERCLEKDSKRRLRDIGDAGAELDDRRPDAPAVAPKRRTLLAAALPWTLLVFAAGSLAWFWSRPAGDGSLGGMQARPVTNDPGYSGEPALSPDGRLLAYSSDRAGAGNRDIWVQQVDGGNPLRLTDDLADDSRPDFSPDAGQIAFRSERSGGGVYVVPALGGTPRLLARGGRSPKFSPDGTRVAYWTGQFRGSSAAMESEVYVVSLAGGAPVRLMRDFAVANNPIWAPDSRSLLVLGRRTMTGPASVLDFWRAPVTGDAAEATGVMGWQGLREEIVSTGRADLGLGSWTSRGFLIARHANLWMLPLSASGRLAGPPRQLTLSTASFSVPAISHDGQVMFSAISLSRNIERLPLDTASQPEVLYTDSNDNEWRASTSRDGATIVFERLNGRRHEIWAKNTIMGEQHLISSVQSDALVNATVSSDGTRVSYTLLEPGENQTSEGSTFVIEVSGGVPQKICEHCSAWGFLSDSQRVLLTDRGRAIQFLARDAAHDVVVAPPGQRIDRPSVPPDERAIAFRVGQGAKTRVYVAPLAGRTVPESQWTMIDESTNTGRPCGWSPDSSTLYLLLDTDGFRDLWGQKVEDGRPLGKPYVVRHLHKTTGVSTSLGNAITAQGFLYEAGRLTGNIWRLEPQSAAR